MVELFNHGGISMWPSFIFIVAGVIFFIKKFVSINRIKKIEISKEIFKEQDNSIIIEYLVFTKQKILNKNLTYIKIISIIPFLFSAIFNLWLVAINFYLEGQLKVDINFSWITLRWISKISLSLCFGLFCTFILLILYYLLKSKINNTLLDYKTELYTSLVELKPSK